MLRLKWRLCSACVMLLVIVSNVEYCCCAGKSVLDFNDLDVEKLYEEWEDNDDDHEEQERDLAQDQPDPETIHTMLKSDNFDPQELLKQSKKGKPMMIFVGVRGIPPDRAHTESVSTRWVQSLQNAHIHVERYIVAPDRVLLLSQDGSLAWKIKDYLVTLSECTTVSFEQLKFDCDNDRKIEL